MNGHKARNSTSTFEFVGMYVSQSLLVLSDQTLRRAV
jgi:hypothetical protein